MNENTQIRFKWAFGFNIGLGCMGLTWAYGKTNEKESLRVLQRAFELGINFFDTAEVYGPFSNEELIGKAIRSMPRDKLILASKFGFNITNDKEITGLNSNPSHIKQSIEGSLKRLGTDYIDLYYQHRLDPTVQIEDVISTLADLVKEGKIRYIGLSEVGPATIRRAHQVHPITALQTEYSLWERSPEEIVFPILQELGIGFVAYSPLGCGFLTGKINSVNDLDKNDWRRDNFPRIQDKNLAHNRELVKKITEIASKFKATPGQIALNWLIRQNEFVVPIPGTKHVHYLEENINAIDLEVPETVWNSLDEYLNNFEAAGPRYLESNMQFISTK